MSILVTDSERVTGRKVYGTVFRQNTLFHSHGVGVELS